MKYIVKPRSAVTEKVITLCAQCSEDPRFCGNDI
jgi:hypothetical protein